MHYSIGTTYEGRDFDYLKAILPHVNHIEISPDSLAFKKGGQTHIDPASLKELVWAQQNSNASLLVHGVSLSIGSHDGYSMQYIRLMEELFESLQIKWHSEHLAYTTVNGEPLGTMLTLPRTDEAIDLVCSRVGAIQKKFKVPFLLENVINMLPPPDAQYSEAAFLNRIVSLTGCGLVLDVYNLECDAHNFGLDVAAFLEELDIDNVYEMHVAGGLTDAEYDFKMDIHARLTESNTIGLAMDIIEKKPKRLQAITYEILEEFIPKIGAKNIIAELKKLHNIFNAVYEPELVAG